jgi:hypothetical protein
LAGSLPVIDERPKSGPKTKGKTMKNKSTTFWSIFVCGALIAVGDTFCGARPAMMSTGGGGYDGGGNEGGGHVAEHHAAEHHSPPLRHTVSKSGPAPKAKAVASGGTANEGHPRLKQAAVGCIKGAITGSEEGLAGAAVGCVKGAIKGGTKSGMVTEKEEMNDPYFKKGIAENKAADAKRVH